MKLSEVSAENMPHFQCGPCRVRFRIINWVAHYVIQEGRLMHSPGNVYLMNLGNVYLMNSPTPEKMISHLAEIEVHEQNRSDRWLFRCNASICQQIVDLTIGKNNLDIILSESNSYLLTGKENKLKINTAPRLCVQNLKDLRMKNHEFLQNEQDPSEFICAKRTFDKPAYHFLREGFRFQRERDYNFFRIQS